ncbi:MAG: hypothetical protein RhofKO_16300 [Rhodothermales bacterium]
MVLISCQLEEKEKPFLLGQGIGISSATLMVQDVETAIAYYRDSLGFNIRSAAPGVFEGSVAASIGFSDMAAVELLAIDDSLQASTPEFINTFLASGEGVRLFALSSSSVDSAFMALTASGYPMDSIRSYRSSASVQEGWSRDDGNPTRKSLDFNAFAPPAHLPRFIENVGLDYPSVNDDWRTYYIYGRTFNKHPNGVVGMAAVRIAVQDLEAAHDEFAKMGFEVLEQNETLARYRLARQQELHVVAADHDASLGDFVARRGEGVFALRFEVADIDSTYQYLKNELPSSALARTTEHLSVLPEYAFGVRLEFVQEPEAQGLMVRSLNPLEERLDSLAIVYAGEMYTKYCALCHGENREGYAADNAPSLRSHSLLATSMNNNFMRYTIQYGRANTAMAGYLESHGGPMEYIEIELLLKYLYEMAEVDEPVDVSREPVLGDIAAGAEVYTANCAVCHGENGEGVSAPALGHPMLLATATDHFLRYAIAEGRDGTPMMAFKDSLSSQEIDDVTAFLRSRAAGWDIPEPIEVTIPVPEDYVLNPDREAPVFDLRAGKFVSAVQVNQAIQDSLRMIILDARSEVAWRQMHIPGAVPVPFYEDPDSFINDIPNDDTPIVIYCACPHAASERVQSTLRRHGFKNTAIIDEGILVWAQMGFPVRNGS